MTHKYAGCYNIGRMYGGKPENWQEAGELEITRTGGVIMNDVEIKNPRFSADTLEWSIEQGNKTSAKVTFSQGSSSSYHWPKQLPKGLNFTGWIREGTGGNEDFRGIPNLGTWVGMYYTATKYGGEHGKWNADQMLAITDARSLTFRGKRVQDFTFFDGELKWTRKENGCDVQVQFALGSTSKYHWPTQLPSGKNFTGGLTEGTSGTVDFRGAPDVQA